MRVIPILAFVITSFLAVPALAQNSGAATDDDVMNAIHGAKSGHGSTIATPTPAAEPAPAPAPTAAEEQEQPNGEPPPAISDLRDQQIQIENEEERKKAKGVFTRPEGEAAEDGEKKDEECTAKDVASAMQAPATFAAYQAGGGAAVKKPAFTPQNSYVANIMSEEQKRAEGELACNQAYDKLTVDCDPTAKTTDCPACETALKKYNEACSYVKGKEELINVPGMGGNGMNSSTLQPITNIPFQPGGRPHGSGGQ